MLPDLNLEFWDLNRLIAGVCFIYVFWRGILIYSSPNATALMSIDGVGEKISDRITDFLRPKDAKLSSKILLFVWGFSSLLVLIFELPQETESLLVSTTGVALIISYLMLTFEFLRFLWILFPFTGYGA